MDPYIYMSYIFIYLIMVIYILKMNKLYLIKSNILLLVIVALIFDNGILSIGKFIGEGELLKGLNILRYIFHALFTPLLVQFSLVMIKRSGVSWAGKKWINLLILLSIVGLILIELTNVIGFKLGAKLEYGVLSYEPINEPLTPPIMVLSVSMFLLVASVIILVKQKWPWFLIAMIIMAIGTLISRPIESKAVTNGFELVLMISLILTTSFQIKQLKWK